jgi:hypothetical protein
VTGKRCMFGTAGGRSVVFGRVFSSTWRQMPTIDLFHNLITFSLY